MHKTIGVVNDNRMHNMVNVSGCLKMSFVYTMCVYCFVYLCSVDTELCSCCCDPTIKMPMLKEGATKYWRGRAKWQSQQQPDRNQLKWQCVARNSFLYR